MTARASALFVSLCFVFAWVPQAQAAGETATFDLSVTPRSTLYSSAYTPADISFSGDIETNQAEILPLKQGEFTFSDIVLDVNPNTPVCEGVGPSTGGTVSSVVALCPNSLVGNGTARFQLGRDTDPSATRLGSILLFNGGEQNGNLLIKVYVWNSQVNASLYFVASYKDQKLSFDVPRLTSDSAVSQFQLAIPGSTVPNPDPIGGVIPGGIADGIITRARCSQGSFGMNASLTLGERAFSGEPIGPEVVLSGSKSVPCSSQGAGPNTDVRVKVLGKGSVSSTPQGIDNCRSSCERSFLQGQKVNLTATPDAGKNFVGWSNGCSGSATTCQISLWESKEVTATFSSTPPAGPVGFTINNGARYTNKPRVDLKVIWPPEFGSALISNDGGFGVAQEVALEPVIPWTLDSSGPERLPKTVYLRFGSSTQTFTDDIILDETKPIITSAKAKISKRRTLLRISAKDRISGLATIQAGPKRSSKLKKIPYRKSVRIAGTERKLWIRVNDRAGNSSKWISRSVKRR